MLKTAPQDTADIEEIRLDVWLQRWCPSAPVAATLNCFAAAAATVAGLVARGPLAGALGTVVGGNTGGDAQKDLDLRADRIFRDALRDAPIAALASEEAEAAAVLQPGAPVVVAIDPLDGSSNIDTNVTIGSIIAILPNVGDNPLAALLQPGEKQLAAAFAVYGPQTALALTIGAGTHIFTLDRRTGAFMLTRPDVKIPLGQREYAINASNYRHWHAPIRAYIDDCISGEDGPRGENFNMRWIASLVAEAYRVLARGGVFLYPRDDRPDYGQGRLRLVYEANPIAFLIEQAGGGATDGQDRILDMIPSELHGRVPLVFGSRDKVERVARYHKDRHLIGERSPLFGKRGLFRS